MDVVRPRRRAFGRLPIVSFAACAFVAAGAWFAVPGLFTGSRALPGVARDAVVIDRVRRETLVRSVRASGVLVADRVDVVASAADGTISQLAIRPGQAVQPETVIATLDNPELNAAVVDANAEVTSASAALRSAREEAAASHLDRDASYRTATAQSQVANNESEADATLVRDGLVGTLAARQALIRADEARELRAIAARKIGVDRAEGVAKVAFALAAVERAEAALTAARARVETLVVRAGRAGVVQSVSVNAGERATAGTEIARIARPDDLKAVLQVAEGDMRGIAPGLDVDLDTDGSGTLRGRVERIAPVAVNGSIAIDVVLLRAGTNVRAAQNVDGTIRLFRLRNVLALARPAGALDGTSATIFRLANDGTRAYRTHVTLGSGSQDRVEIRAGLALGSRAIVSDTSAFENDPVILVTSR